MCRSIEIVERMLKEKLDREQYQRIGGGNMDAILFVPYVSSSEDDRIKECVNGIMQNMHLEIPGKNLIKFIIFFFIDLNNNFKKKIIF